MSPPAFPGILVSLALVCLPIMAITASRAGAAAEVAVELIADGKAAPGARLAAGVEPGVTLEGQEGLWVRAPIKAQTGSAGFHVELERPFDADRKSVV